ncbi:hypothetical protein D1159_02100 [Pseudoflavonifractor sp. 524-17]|uniref:hypothetical protein n=1 Tax=Pseudoflavonifractor sp. 524-17 TaxID=2304577 RepID=UPI00192A2DE1|nr:hypothetical protein [Pseudoflavonifractor sp. 524-17]NCE63400.1 hypothetical protein [Pseudoflavonifractor sp. 524-17]
MYLFFASASNKGVFSRAPFILFFYKVSETFTFPLFSTTVFRVCFKPGNMPGGEEFFRLASGFDAGILTDFKEKPRRSGGKRPALWAC